MLNEDSRISEKIIRSLLGEGIPFDRLRRDDDHPINVVLDEAQETSGLRFNVYTTHYALPSHFCLRGPDAVDVVYNWRYVELGYLLSQFHHSIFDEKAYEKTENGLIDLGITIRQYIAESVCAKIISELTLTTDPRLSVRMLLKSAINREYAIADCGALQLDLEAQERDEAYTTVYFLGLLHEIGHGVQGDIRDAVNTVYTDEWIFEKLRECAREFPQPEPVVALVAETLEQKIRQCEPGSIYHPDSIRDEMVADAFAFEVLLKSTTKIMSMRGENPPFGSFCWQYFAYINNIVIIQRCKYIGEIAASQLQDEEKNSDMLLQPILYMVRNSNVTRICNYIANGMLRAQGIETEYDMAGHLNPTLRNVIDEVEKGMSRALRFAFYSDRSDDQLFAEFINGSPDPQAFYHANLLCQRAKALRIESPLLDTLSRLCPCQLSPRSV